MIYISHIRQSRPGSGLGLQAENLKNCTGVLSLLESCLALYNTHAAQLDGFPASFWAESPRPYS